MCTAIQKYLFLIAEQLLKAGADPNAQFQMENDRNRKDSPLTFAVSSKRKRAIEVLLRGGADPHAENSDGQSPLLGAPLSDPQPWLGFDSAAFAIAGCRHPLEVILDHLYQICCQVYRYTCKLVEYEQSPLMRLEKKILRGESSIWEEQIYLAPVIGWTTFNAVLLQRGTDPNLRYNGKTPLQAVMRKLHDIVDSLLFVHRGYLAGSHVEQLIAVAMILLENGGHLNQVSRRCQINYSKE